MYEKNLERLLFLAPGRKQNFCSLGERCQNFISLLYETQLGVKLLFGSTG